MAGRTKEQLRAIGKIGGSNGNGKDKTNPLRVAEKVIEQIKKKELVNPSKAALEIGYSRVTVDKSISKITRNPQYVQAMDNFLSSLKEKRAMVQALTTEEDIKKATLRDKVYATDVYSKNINLIEGKPTDITANMGAFLFKIEEEAKKQEDK